MHVLGLCCCTSCRFLARPGEGVQALLQCCQVHTRGCVDLHRQQKLEAERVGQAMSSPRYCSDGWTVTVSKQPRELQTSTLPAPYQNAADAQG